MNGIIGINIYLGIIGIIIYLGMHIVTCLKSLLLVSEVSKNAYASENIRHAL